MRSKPPGVEVWPRRSHPFIGGPEKIKRKCSRWWWNEDWRTFIAGIFGAAMVGAGPEEGTDRGGGVAEDRDSHPVPKRARDGGNGDMTVLWRGRGKQLRARRCAVGGCGGECRGSRNGRGRGLSAFNSHDAPNDPGTAGPVSGWRVSFATAK